MKVDFVSSSALREPYQMDSCNYAINSSVLTANIDHINNMPLDITSSQPRLQAHFAPMSTSRHTIIDIAEEMRTSSPSPTPSESSIHEQKRLYSDHVVSIKTDDDAGDKPNHIKRYAKNIGLAASRSVIGVAIPTAMREYARRVVLPALFQHVPSHLMPTVGGVTAAFPLALQLFGIVRDIRNGTQTGQSLSARLTNVAMVMGAGTAAALTGGLGVGAYALMAAVLVYVPTRDLAQYLVLLTDNNKDEIKLAPSCASAVLYAGNQFAVDFGMDLISDALAPLMGGIPANVLGRALVNTVGETCDEITYRGFNAISQQNPGLALTMRLRKPKEFTLKSATDCMANTLSSRAALFSSGYAGSYAFPLTGIPGNALVGATIGAGYLPFIYSHAQKSPEAKAIDDMEAGRLPA